MSEPAKPMHTSFGVGPGDHYKAFHWLPLVLYVPTEVSTAGKEPLPGRTPLEPNGSSVPRLHHTSPDGSGVPRLPRTCLARTPLVSPNYLARPHPYLAHGCTVFMGGRSITGSLRFG